MNKLIKRRFKYAFGTTLVTSSLLLMSHGHAFAVTNNIDQAFNHDNNGQPITSQDSNNNVDPLDLTMMLMTITILILVSTMM